LCPEAKSPEFGPKKKKRNRRARKEFASITTGKNTGKKLWDGPENEVEKTGEGPVLPIHDQTRKPGKLKNGWG